MRVLQWIIVLAAIVLFFFFGLKTAGAGLTEDGKVTTEAFSGLVWIAVTYLSTKVLFSLKSK